MLWSKKKLKVKQWSTYDFLASFWGPMLLNFKKSKEILENLVTFRQNPYKNWSWKCLKITLVNGRRSLHNADLKFGLPRETNEEICYMPKELRKDSYLKVFQEGSSTNNVNSFPWQAKENPSTNNKFWIYDFLHYEHLLWCVF